MLPDKLRGHVQSTVQRVFALPVPAGRAEHCLWQVLPVVQ